MKKEIGISIIIIGLLISIISPMAVVLVGIPIFIVGSILLWLSKSNIKTKTIWTVAPVVLWYPITIVWLFVYNAIGMANAQKRDYIVNYDFKGLLTIVESKCGKEPILKAKRMQFEIPSNGVYLHNGELKSGHIDERVFKKNKDGTLIRLEDVHWQTKDSEKDTAGLEIIIGERFGTFGTRYDSNDQESNVITKYIETNKIYTEKETNKLHFRMDRLVDSLLSNCDK